MFIYSFGDENAKKKQDVRVSVFLPQQEYEQLKSFVQKSGMTWSYAIRYQIAQGSTLRASVRAEVLRDVAPALRRLGDASADMLVAWCRHRVELTPILGAEEFALIQSEIAAAINELTRLIRAA